jgi:predicted ATP-grasp superfamily ATP-dependent carboligase
MTNYLSEAKATIEGMSGTRVLVEDYEKLKALSDKWHTYKIAVRLGIPAPKSVLLDGSEAMRVGIDSLNFPVVAKPRVSYAAIGVKFFETREQFQAWLASDGCLNGDYLVQERVDGELHDVTACAQEGRAVSVLSQKRLKSLYDFGGGGVVNITTDEPKAREYAVRIINEVGWNGPIEFDFILAADGDFYLLECNPKIWGTTYLTVRAGMNIVQQTVDVYMKEGALPAVREYQVGLLYRWLFPECLFNWIQKPRTMKNVARRIAETYRGYDAQHIESNINMADIPHLLGMVFDRAQL